MKLEEMASKVIVRKLKAIVRMERRADRDALLYLYELDRRGDIARDSYGTIVDYCVELLGMGVFTVGAHHDARGARTAGPVRTHRSERRLGAGLRAPGRSRHRIARAPILTFGLLN